MFRSKIKLKQILISERNKKNSSALSKQFKKVKVVKNNQDIINNSSWVFIAVVPTVAKKILQELTFKKNQTVVSFVSTLNMNYLEKTIRPATSIVKAAPLPTIASTLGPIILFPNNAKVTKFFNHLGMAIVAKNEQENNHLWAMTATMATFFEYCNTLESWLVKRKVNPNKAKDLIASLMFGLSHSMLLSKTKTKQLVSDYQTKKGINEEFLKGLKQSGTFNAMNSNLTKILERIKKAND